MIGRTYTEEDRKLIQQHINHFESRSSLTTVESYCLQGLQSELNANHSEAIYKYIKSGNLLALTRISFMVPELESVKELLSQGKDLSQLSQSSTPKKRSRKARDQIAEKSVARNQEVNTEATINKSQPVEPALFERNAKDQLLILTYLKNALPLENEDGISLSQIETKIPFMPSVLLRNILEDLVQSEYVQKNVRQNKRYYSITEQGLKFAEILFAEEKGTRNHQAPDSNKPLLSSFLPNFSLRRYAASYLGDLSTVSQTVVTNEKGKEKNDLNDSLSKDITHDTVYILLRLLDEAQEEGVDFTEIQKKIPLKSKEQIIGLIGNLLHRGLITELYAYYYCINDEGKAYLAQHSSEAVVSTSEEGNLFGATSQFCPAFSTSTYERGQTRPDMSQRPYPPFTPAALLQTEELEHAQNSSMQFKTCRI